MEALFVTGASKVSTVQFAGRKVLRNASTNTVVVEATRRIATPFGLESVTHGMVRARTVRILVGTRRIVPILGVSAHFGCVGVVHLQR